MSFDPPKKTEIFFICLAVGCLGIYAPSKFKYIWQELDSILSITNNLVILGIIENQIALKKVYSKRLMILIRYRNIHYSLKSDK